MSSFARGLLALSWLITGIAILAAVGVGWQRRSAAPEVAAHDEAHHDHASEADPDSLELSPQAAKNIGLITGKVKLDTFEKSIAIPGIVVERRGRSKLTISSPLTGIVTRILRTEGETVSPGDLLFELRLTHEELVQSQADLLRLSEELVVLDRDIARIEEASKNGAIAGKVLIERQHEKHKQEAMIRAQRQALLLHGLSEEQVDAIVETHVLLRTLEVRVPTNTSQEGPEPIWQVQELRVEQGQQAQAGEALAVLTDHAELLVEGDAFEQDAQAIVKALQENRSISATLETKNDKPHTIEGLKLLYQTNRVEPTARTLHFYAVLPNKRVRDTGEQESHRFIDWLYRPGQRMTLRVPVETWKERIVLPLAAIAQDGPETYVFQVNGGRFEKRPVHVEHRDQQFVVVANDGSIFPGDEIAMSAAPQLLMALRNKSGGAIDPHAGHHH